MTNQEIISKLWGLCNVLRDDGITYHQYVTELTYILFLKMASETGFEDKIPKGYRWENLTAKSGVALKNFYKDLLNHLSENGEGLVRKIYRGATTNIDEPKNLKKIISNIDALDWYSAQEEGLGNLYEGLLEKNANEKKSGAGQYFTPRALIDVIVRLMKPQVGERCNDPACGTFGFMIAASQYVRANTNNLDDLDTWTADFEITQAFTGCELVPDTHRLALMNAMLHGIEGEIKLGDTLSSLGKSMKNFDLVLTNPPFGTKKGGERATRDDLTFTTSNKQLNFLQHIYRSLKVGGRAAVVLPDNVLFADGEGANIRVDLMDKCNLHTILRLPTGIFYAQGVKTNVLFFTRGTSDKGNTNEVWFYDMRTNMPTFGKTNPLTKNHFAAFEKAFNAEDRRAVQDERFSVFTREQIAEKNNSLDLGLIRDDSISDVENFPDIIDDSEDILRQLNQAAALMFAVIAELNSIGLKKNDTIPVNWRLALIGDVAKLYTGNSINEKIKLEKYFGLKNGLTYIATKNISFDNEIEYETNIKIPETDGFKIAPQNSALLCIEGGSAGRKVAFTNQPVCFVNKLCCFTSDENNSKFIYYFLQTQNFIQQFNAQKHGLIGGVSIKNLSALKIPLPPFAEQKRIVARIESLFGKLDAAKSIAQKIFDGFELRRAAILHLAFTGALTEHFRADCGLTLDDWQRVTLGDICTINPPKISTKGLPDDLQVSFFPMASLSEVEGKITCPQIKLLGEVKRGYTNFSEGDIVFAKITPCMENGKSAVIGKLVNGIGYGTTEFFVLRCNEPILNQFLYHLVRSKKFRNSAKVVMAGAVGQQRVPKKFLTDYELNLPPFAEQKEIVRILDSLLDKEQQTKELAEKILTEIESLKKNILRRAFRGELGTNDPTEKCEVIENESAMDFAR